MAIFDQINQAARTTRLHNLLAQGVDQIAAKLALDRGWDLVAPLPFGAGLNIALNSDADSVADVSAICAGNPASNPETQAKVAAIRALIEQSQTYEFSERDEDVRALLERMLMDRGDADARKRFELLTSEHYARAASEMIARSSLIIAVWDGKQTDLAGGTGHTALAALKASTPVLLIDCAKPDQWSILTRPEELGRGGYLVRSGAATDSLRDLILEAVRPG